MRLLAFRVHEFRSVDDSGWIEVDQVTGLIGTNESGKTNVLIPLWKLKPANGGAIDPMADYPRKRYHEIRALETKPTFIEARFDLSEELRGRIAESLAVAVDRVSEVLVSRDFDGKYSVSLLKPDTAHSPFMVDADHLDRARAVYTDDAGVTRVSPDLQAPSDNSDRSRSVYAAYAALRMAVSETLLLGCQPVIVEGPSDQHYLSAIKNFLVGLGDLRPSREIVFMPAGGVKGVKAVCALVMGRDDALPFVLLDADTVGRQFAESLRASLYRGDDGRVLSMGDVVQVPECEIEDLVPPEFIGRIVDRYLAKPADVDEDLVETLTEGKPIVPQIEEYASNYDIVLKRGWKVDVAKRVKGQLLRNRAGADAVGAAYVETWRKLFALLQHEGEQR